MRRHFYNSLLFHLNSQGRYRSGGEGGAGVFSLCLIFRNIFSCDFQRAIQIYQPPLEKAGGHHKLYRPAAMKLKLRCCKVQCTCHISLGILKGLSKCVCVKNYTRTGCTLLPQGCWFCEGNMGRAIQLDVF